MTPASPGLARPECPVCYSRLAEVIYSCIQCDNLFCESCSVRLVTTKSICPMCRVRFEEGVNPVRNKAVERLVQQ